MDVGAVDGGLFEFLPVLELAPDVAASGEGAVDRFEVAHEHGVVAAYAVEAGYGVLTALDLETGSDALTLFAVYMEIGSAQIRIGHLQGEGPAVPDQLGVVIVRMAGGELAEEGILMAQRGAAKQAHHDYPVHIGFAGDEHPLAVDDAVCQAGRPAEELAPEEAVA